MVPFHPSGSSLVGDDEAVEAPAATRRPFCRSSRKQASTPLIALYAHMICAGLPLTMHCRKAGTYVSCRSRSETTASKLCRETLPTPSKLYASRCLHVAATPRYFASLPWKPCSKREE